MKVRVLSICAVTLASAAALVHCGSSDDVGGGGEAHDAAADGTVGCGARCADAGDGSTSPEEDGSRDAGSDGADARDDAPAIPDADAGSDAADAADASDGAIACSAQNPCADAGPCCNGVCADTTRDPFNCGGCGNACGASQFCTGVRCAEAVIASVCAMGKASVVFDGQEQDDKASTAIAAGLATCNPAPQVVLVSQDGGTAGVLEADGGKPITGPGHLFAAGGGGFLQRGIAYMNEKALSPVYVTGTPTDGGLIFSYVRRGDGSTIASAFEGDLSSSHDLFLVEVMHEPTSSTFVLSAQGLLGRGTVAAGWWFQNVAMPAIATDGGTDAGAITDRWYVYEWTDTNADGEPNAGDSWVRRGSGK